MTKFFLQKKVNNIQQKKGGDPISGGKEGRREVKGIARTYEEICEDLRTAKPGKQARELHKELKAYGDGLSLADRYPNIIWIPAIIAVVITAFVVIWVTVLLILTMI